ncbi:HD family phosphohydrolase [Halobacillus andaensis]|uniref:HD family phosphohydrolase n=1 Tax=Halobacillus andaensis TaxID=1176239 RepID=A0A917EVA8_HALAA|nr:HD-GYP domain-containing protein [Halobacillus andaensis]MBP2005007.1 HD-GYP domain-containing protein (c-di-GMP phosphodiesterase class II) [Halobacillus andaensis]GGF17275.1 HD family phosphohydrolase [Halobacillus andaensis]
MKVHPSQLQKGCIITKEVMAKTKKPIIPKHTVVQPIHLSVLHKFSIQQVEVGPRLSSGAPFVPTEQEPPEKKENNLHEPPSKEFPFHEHYLEGVKHYQEWFLQWQGGSAINMHEVRTFMVPLIEKAVHSKRELFLLHHYSSEDTYAAHHSVAMGLISAYLAAKLGYSRGEWIQAGLAGLLSDSGMARIDSTITQKRGPLTEKEYEEVKKHATYSYRLVENIASLGGQAKLGVLQHHERLDGTGYPLGLRKGKIHRFSQIIAVSDMYHAMTSERFYRKKQSPFKVLEEMKQEQFGRYDHEVIQVFIKEMTNYSTGTKVRLTTNQMAEVVFMEPSHPTRPMVRLKESGQIISLKDRTDLHIDEVYEA